MRSLFPRLTLSVSLLAICSCVSISESACCEDRLTIGSTAPSLDVEHWVQNGEGKFSKVTQFQKDKVYVVEFWATWCPTCIQSMPHIIEMQKKFASKGVQIISISDEDLADVEEFLKRKLPASFVSEFPEYKTFKDLTKSFCLTTDPDKSSVRDYLEASGRNTLPCTFIIGKDGKIEWIGEPLAMEEPLVAVIDGNWDRNQFAAELKEQEEREALMQDADMQVGKLFRQQKYPEALAKIDEFITKAKDAELKIDLLVMKLTVQQKANSTPKELNGTLESAFQQAGDDPVLVNAVTKLVLKMNDAGRIDSKSPLKLAREATKNVVAKEEGNVKAILLDLLAHVEQTLGNTEGAIQAQEEAISLADAEDKEVYTEFLEELRKQIAKPKK